MKIKFLRLVNFANIYAATKGKKEFVLDLSNSKNRVTVLVGVNGSGKTSVLSELHPFATPGSIDSRSGINLILEGEEGIKEIIIEDDDKLYTIKHIYKTSSNGSRTIKSFIMEDMNELNPNGNVTSFKEIVKDKLGVDHDILRLMRLGSNVSSIIDLSTSNRKTYIGDLFSDLDIYSTFYKNISEKYRYNKNLIKTVVSKIDKLNIIDIDQVVKGVENDNIKLKSLTSTYEDNLSKIGGLKSSIDSYINKYNLNTYNENIHNIKSLQFEITRIENKISESGIIFFSESDINETIDEYKDKCHKYDIDQAVIQTKIDDKFKTLDNLYNDRSELESKINTTVSDKRYEDMVNTIQQLECEIYDDEIKIIDKPIYSKDKLMNLISSLHTLKIHVEKLTEYNINIVKTVLKYISKGLDLRSYIDTNISRLEKEIDELKQEISTNNIQYNVPVIMYRGCSDNECPYVKFYDNITNNINTTNHLSRIEKLTYEIEFYEFHETVLKIIVDIEKMISSNDIFQLIPEYDFSVFNICKSYLKYGKFFDDEELNEFVELSEISESIEMKKKLLSTLKTELSEKNVNGHDIPSLMIELNKINDEILCIDNDIVDLKDSLQTVVDKHDMTSNSISKLYEISEYTSALKTKKIKLEDLLSEVQSQREINEMINELKLSVEVYENDNIKIQHEIDKYNREIKEKEFSIYQYNILIKEKQELENEYQYLEVIRESLSATKGIPLLYLQTFLNNCVINMNHMLEIIYGDELQISDFIINDKVFEIPYMRSGIQISDVAFASQGEKSFIALTLSLCLIMQTIDKYNIILLDEIDATLDTKNREKFIHVLELLLDKIGSEQVFMITHNNMFDSYPVDIIKMSDTNETYMYGNIIN